MSKRVGLAKPLAQRSHLRWLRTCALVVAVIVFGPTTIQTSAQSRQRVAIDGLVATIGGGQRGAPLVYITRSDVDLRARLRLSARTAGGPMLGAIPPRVRAAVLSELIGEHLLAREARRVSSAAPERAALLDARRGLLQMAGGAERFNALVSALGVEDREVQAIADRRARVTEFLARPVARATAIGDDELERAYRELEHPFMGMPFEDASAPLRAWLQRRALEAVVSRWVEQLRAREPVRIYVDFDPQ